MKAFKDFILKEIILTAILSILAFILFQTILKEYYLPVFWVLMATIAIITGTSHYAVLQATKKEVTKFSSKFLMITGIKMLFYLVLLVSYVFLYQETAKFFLIFFLFFYFVYTSFEVVMILRYFKNQSK